MYKLVAIEWTDPQLLELTGLSYPEDIKDIPLQKCVIVGHLVAETKDIFFVAKEVWSNGAFKYVHMIPKIIVDNVRFLK